MVSIAKGADRDSGREQFFVEGREPFRLPPRDPALYFVQRLRDEAHRFAIGTHRARRKKFVKSPLDEIARASGRPGNAPCSPPSARPRPFPAPRWPTWKDAGRQRRHRRG